MFCRTADYSHPPRHGCRHSTRVWSLRRCPTPRQADKDGSSPESSRLRSFGASRPSLFRKSPRTWRRDLPRSRRNCRNLLVRKMAPRIPGKGRRFGNCRSPSAISTRSAPECAGARSNRADLPHCTGSAGPRKLPATRRLPRPSGTPLPARRRCARCRHRRCDTRRGRAPRRQRIRG